MTKYGELLKGCFTAVFLLTAVGMDLSSRRIKNGWILFGLAVGLLLRFPIRSAAGGGDLLAGILLPVFICWIPFLMRVLGAGDIKLFSVIGCLYGGRDVICCIGFSFLAAAVFSLAKLIANRLLRTSLIHCFHYFQQIFTEGMIMPYPMREDPDHLIHVSVAVLCGFGVFLGVKYCRIMPLF